MQGAHKTNELFDIGDGLGLMLEGFVSLQQSIDVLARRTSQEFPHSGKAQLADGRAQRGGLPDKKRGQLCLHRGPTRFCQF